MKNQRQRIKTSFFKDGDPFPECGADQKEKHLLVLDFGLIYEESHLNQIAESIFQYSKKAIIRNIIPVDNVEEVFSSSVSTFLMFAFEHHFSRHLNWSIYRKCGLNYIKFKQTSRPTDMLDLNELFFEAGFAIDLRSAENQLPSNYSEELFKLFKNWNHEAKIAVIKESLTAPEKDNLILSVS